MLVTTKGLGFGYEGSRIRGQYERGRRGSSPRFCMVFVHRDAHRQCKLLKPLITMTCALETHLVEDRFSTFQNRGPQYRPQYIAVIIMGTLKKEPQILRKPSLRNLRVQVEIQLLFKVRRYIGDHAVALNSQRGRIQGIWLRVRRKGFVVFGFGGPTKD